MSDTSRRVLVTGGQGRIAQAISPRLPADWELRLTDVADLDVTDIEACRGAFRGVDAVVHLAAMPDPDATWSQLHAPNVVGAYTVAQAAADCGLRRLVLASSLHAVSGIPASTQTRAEDPPRPGNLYGATKAWAEALGAWLAATTSTSVVALRIGYFAAKPPGADSAPPLDRAAWLSPRDAAELVRAAVEAEVTGFVVANGTSANRYRQADLDSTCDRLGYSPADDAWA